MSDLHAYECRLRGENEGQVIHERSRNRAKGEYLLRIRDVCPDAKYTDIRVRCIGSPKTSERFLKTARYRGVPFARIGMRVSVGGEYGVLVGTNSAANFDVLFDEKSRYKGMVLNCHPWHEMTFYREDGTEIAK